MSILKRIWSFMTSSNVFTYSKTAEGMTRTHNRTGKVQYYVVVPNEGFFWSNIKENEKCEE